jgi:MoaA/NifB/PqqE/SkfB family radical SAM enzyme
MKKPWCTEPFNTIENAVWGQWGLCCRSTRLPYNAKDVSPLEHFNSDTMKQVRRDMLEHKMSDDIQRLCQKCIKHEADGNISMRQDRLKYDQTPYRSIQSAIDNDGEIKDFAFRSVEIKFFGNLCNLQCKMCGPTYSSSIAATQKKDGTYDGPVHVNVFADMQTSDQEKLYKDLEQIIPNTHQIKFTGGEPMMNKGIEQMVQWIVDKGYNKSTQITIITNGTKVNHNLLELCSKFKRFLIRLSLDGVWDINDYQRVGADFNDINNNISEYKRYANSICIDCTVTAISVNGLAELGTYAQMKELAINFSSIALHPDYLQIKVLPIPYRNKLIEKYSNPAFNAVVFMKPEEVIIALEDPEWNQDLWEMFLEKNPDIVDVIPELKEYINV